MVPLTVGTGGRIGPDSLSVHFSTAGAAGKGCAVSGCGEVKAYLSPGTQKGPYQGCPELHSENAFSSESCVSNFGCEILVM